MITRRDLLRFATVAPIVRCPIIPPLLLPSNSPKPVATGVPALDVEIGGGWRRGRMTQLFGTDGVGLWFLPFTSTQAALRHGLHVTWISTDNQMICDYGRAVGFNIDGVRDVRISKLEATLNAIEQASRDSDLIVCFALLDTLPTISTEPPCKAVRRIARAIRQSAAAVVITTDGDEAAVVSTQVGRAVRFYSKCRVRVSHDAGFVVNFRGYLSRLNVVKYVG